MEALAKSIDPKLWALKEMHNVELLLKEGKSQLMTSWDCLCSEEIPELYYQLVNGEWEDFISIDEIRHFDEAKSKYLEDNEFDFESYYNHRMMMILLI